ncbi:hypothetical protein Q7C36_004054 [Tachysurus vachellii]|uniref:Protein FMC1 homolog n=1 Tax=Tachysurus vachellii TaxID=175792 RepID=A0AA88T9W4_TACVA|nr:hypothetical protein Q7C36_004054 [Tachysurus vachellii]
MAAISAPRLICRGIIKELRYLKGPEYKDTIMYNYVLEQFRNNQVTSKRLCRAQREAVHMSHTYLCLLESTRRHLDLHNLYHGKGERPTDEVAGLVGLRLPTQPGGKGWEK